MWHAAKVGRYVVEAKPAGSLAVHFISCIYATTSLQHNNANKVAKKKAAADARAAELQAAMKGKKGKNLKV